MPIRLEIVHDSLFHVKNSTLKLERLFAAQVACPFTCLSRQGLDCVDGGHVVQGLRGNRRKCGPPKEWTVLKA